MTVADNVGRAGSCAPGSWAHAGFGWRGTGAAGAGQAGDGNRTSNRRAPRSLPATPGAVEPAAAHLPPATGPGLQPRHYYTGQVLDSSSTGLVDWNGGRLSYVSLFPIFVWTFRPSFSRAHFNGTSLYHCSPTIAIHYSTAFSTIQACLMPTFISWSSVCPAQTPAHTCGCFARLRAHYMLTLPTPWPAFHATYVHLPGGRTARGPRLGCAAGRAGLAPTGISQTRISHRVPHPLLPPTLLRQHRAAASLPPALLCLAASPRGGASDEGLYVTALVCNYLQHDDIAGVASTCRLFLANFMPPARRVGYPTIFTIRTVFVAAERVGRTR